MTLVRGASARGPRVEVHAHTYRPTRTITRRLDASQFVRRDIELGHFAREKFRTCPLLRSGVFADRRRRLLHRILNPLAVGVACATEALGTDSPPVSRAAVLTPRKNASNYAFWSEPEPGLGGRKDFHPLGRGFGGGSAINTLNYVRGHRLDYDEWAADGNPGWRYEDVLGYFIRSENNQRFRGGYHGNDGPTWVEDPRSDIPWHGIVKQACHEAGWKEASDFNGADDEGFMSAQVMMKNGARLHSGDAYVRPQLGKRPGLALHCKTECTRILFEGRRAVGAQVVQSGQRRIIRARREVLLAGGNIRP
jgi:choline dehydrogenase-like flavoprotein